MIGRFSYQARRAFSTPSSSCDGPLTGIKVLDLTRILAGPSCTMTLADFGADVYKIEHVKGGDGTRAWAPFLKGSKMSSYFVSLNRNKKSVCVNFQSAQGQKVLRDLARKCDVLIENYVPGVLRKYNLDYDSLKSVAPRLVYCSISGFGSQGPYAQKPGVDLIAASYTAFLSMTGPKGGEPCRAAVSTIDLMTGLHAEGAILAALLERHRTGRGRKIDTNLFSTGVWALKGYALNYLNLGLESTRMGTEHESVVPYKAFECRDGYVTVGAINDDQFEKFCSILGVAELGADKRFVTCKDRAENREALYELLEPIFTEKTTSEWCELFDGTSLPHAPLNTVSQSPTPPILRLKCRKPKSDKSVKWNEGTVDNENMNKKKSKCCCIYKKPKQRLDESSESESDECENCFGHVEVKKQKQLAKSGCCESSTSASTSQEVPVQPIPPSEITAGST